MSGGWLKLTSVDLGWLGNLERRLIGWLYDRMAERLGHRFGGIQQCPWCKQVAQAHDGWHFDSKTDPTIDALYCGNCGGVSRWRFEMGMIPLDPVGQTTPAVEVMVIPKDVEVMHMTIDSTPPRPVGIPWVPIADMPEEWRRNGEVLLWEDGYARAASWSFTRNRWEDCDTVVRDPTHAARINSPEGL